MLDSLNPERYPQFRIGGPQRPEQLAIHQALSLRIAADPLLYEPAIYAVPDDTNIDIAASSTFEARVLLPARSYLWAMSLYSSQPEGCSIQLRDAGNQQELFGGAAAWDLLQPQAVAGVRNAVQMLPAPWLIIDPGVVLVQLWNRSPNINRIQVALFVAQPRREP